MPTEFLREITGPAGVLEARLDLPDGPPRAVAVCGHPHPLHGGTMHTKALYQAAKAMPRIGVAALRFNFRGVGRSAGEFDAGPGEKDDFRAAVTFARLRELARAAREGREPKPVAVSPDPNRTRPPRLTEPWFCCAEPTEGQFDRAV